ncbi:MAG: hypothetical protein AAFW95_14595, partial [Cyanobacteria bacterium J06638_6]
PAIRRAVRPARPPLAPRPMRRRDPPGIPIGRRDRRPVVQEPMSTTRRHDLDWLRVAAFAVLILYHLVTPCR